MTLSAMLAAKKRLIPTSGFNVVAIDGHELPEDSLYLVGHYNTEAEAKKAQAKHKHENPDEPCYLYTPETK